MLKKQLLPGSGSKPLDRWLRELLPDKSWNEVRRLARTGKVFVDGAPRLDPTALVPAGAEVELRQNAPRATRTPSLPRSAILYVDGQVVVVTKPPGISTVPYDENERGTLDQLLMETLSDRGRRAPLGIVHRIDKETSGVVVFARTTAAKLALKNQFRFHTVGRRYVAIAHGTVRSGTIKSRLVQDRGDGRRGSTENEELGRDAVTHVTSLESLRGATLVECRLETGRTHQIRIHLAERGHPLLGERVYSKTYRGELIPAPRVMLHARELSFEHPGTGERLSFEQRVPDDMEAVLATLRGSNSAPRPA
ncbi:MAG: Ribosomal large subunit pseudouridine synthase [Polyangiaceae bacterium]|nr:Ribosomal large subunit pseudouridine synthase [Polyangiaceae bacterium]